MKKYQDKSAKTVYEIAETLYELGAIDTRRMHEYDVECLVPSAVPTRAGSRQTQFVEQNARDMAVGTDSRPGTPIPAVAAARA